MRTMILAIFGLAFAAASLRAGDSPWPGDVPGYKAPEKGEHRYFARLRDRGGLESKSTEPQTASAGGYLKRVNCGGPEVIGPDGVPWSADLANVSGTGRFTAKSEIAGAPAELMEMYQTERWSYTGLSYRFDVEPGSMLSRCISRRPTLVLPPRGSGRLTCC